MKKNQWKDLLALPERLMLCKIQVVLPRLIAALLVAAMPVWGVYAQDSHLRERDRVMGLHEIYELAERESRAIQVSCIGLQAATEGEKSALSARLPQVNLSLSGSYIGNATLLSRGFSTSGTTDVILAGLGPQQVANGKQDTPHWGNCFTAQITQIIYAGGGISSGIRMAGLGKQMAALDVEKDRQKVRFLLTGFYLDLFRLGNQLRVIERNILLTHHVIDNMKARMEQGAVLQNDLTRYELQLQSLQLTRTRIRDARSIINHQLVTTLHLPEGTIVEPDSAYLVSTGMGLRAHKSEQAWQTLAQSSNPELQQAGIAASMAGEKVNSVRAASRPSVALVVEDNLGGPYVTDLIPVNANVNSWFVGLGVKFELSSLWTNRNAIRRAKQEHRQSNERLALAREHMYTRVQAEYVNFLTSFTDVATQRKQVELAQQNYDVVNNRYKNQLALLTDMLDASNMKLTAEMNLVDAHISLLYNYYKLKYTAGDL